MAFDDDNDDDDNVDADGVSLPYPSGKETSRITASNPLVKESKPSDRREVYAIIANFPHSTDKEIMAEWARRLTLRGISERVITGKRQGQRARRGELIEVGVVVLSGTKPNELGDPEETYEAVKPYPDPYPSKPQNACETMVEGIAAIRAKFKDKLPMGVQLVVNLAESSLEGTSQEPTEDYESLLNEV